MVPIHNSMTMAISEITSKLQSCEARQTRYAFSIIWQQRVTAGRRRRAHA